MKQHGKGWGEAFKEMKSQGLVQDRNLGQAVSRQAVSQMSRGGGATAARTEITTASGKTAVVGDHERSGAALSGRRGFGSDAARGDAETSAVVSHGRDGGDGSAARGARGAMEEGAVSSEHPRAIIRPAAVDWVGQTRSQRRDSNVLNSSWNNPWKLTSLGLGLVAATALATSLVVANWTGMESDKTAAVEAGPGRTAPRVASSPMPAAVPAVPTQSAIQACNQYAASQAGQRDKTVDTVKDAGIGAIAGAALGAAGGAIADGGKGAGKGAAIGGLVGFGGGTLYGLNENQKHDERYRNAYGTCMRSRGYTG